MFYIVDVQVCIYSNVGRHILCGTYQHYVLCSICIYSTVERTYSTQNIFTYTYVLRTKCLRMYILKCWKVVFYVEHITNMFYIAYAYTHVLAEHILCRTQSDVHMFYVVNVYVCVYSNVGRSYSMRNILTIYSMQYLHILTCWKNIFTYTNVRIYIYLFLYIMR